MKIALLHDNPQYFSDIRNCTKDNYENHVVIAGIQFVGRLDNMDVPAVLFISTSRGTGTRIVCVTDYIKL